MLLIFIGNNDKYITIPEFSKLTSENFANRDFAKVILLIS